jgi:hypothetical protein
MSSEKFDHRKFRLQRTIGLALALLAGLGSVARAQVYVGNAAGNDHTISKYTTAGATVTSPFIQPSQYASGLAVLGSSLFVADAVNFVIMKYSTDGSLVHGSFITSPNVTMPQGLAASGSYLYVASFGGNKVGKFNADTGAVVDANLITGLGGPWAIAIDGSTLYVSLFNSGKVGKYMTDGTVVNASFITVSSPAGIGVWGSYLFVMTANDIRKYNKTDGSLVDANFLTGLSSPTNLAISGDYLYVTCQGENAVRKYSLPSGTEVGNPLISAGLNAPFSIAVEPPAPTPTPTPTPAPDAPTVTIKGPKKITTPLAAYTLKGRASGATVVKVKVGKKPFKTAAGTTAWKFKAALARGKNQILVQSFNSAGDASAAAKVLIIRK